MNGVVDLDVLAGTTQQEALWAKPLNPELADDPVRVGEGKDTLFKPDVDCAICIPLMQDAKCSRGTPFLESIGRDASPNVAV